MDKKQKHASNLNLIMLEMKILYGMNISQKNKIKYEYIKSI